ncbi:MAG: class I SAM-dependent methyltransferase [Calditrichaceae bacterium]|nr:class I SAM-dependent methyltransferase [Calditrichaceae bacterium]MBN2710475.1 class I SAM-dependent methyltransferase [Calditrichaceae bacterium]RQV93591.1 MAG: class I SAM-dependent methyltransferase [Calditrichota bacterium]
MLKTNKPYSVISSYYDKMMDHVDYVMWANYLKSILKYFGIKGRRIADLSCGTGSLLDNLKIRKSKLVGGDLSINMLKSARIKPGIPLVCADLKASCFKKESFDVVFVLYDSMNYMLSDEDTARVFSEISYTLKPQGWFIFDIVTPYICEKDFHDYHESDFENDKGYERRSWFISNGNKQFNEFIIWDGDKKQVELHEQHIRSLNEWQRLIDESPFELINLFGDFSFRKGHDKSDRIHYICRKK